MAGVFGYHNRDAIRVKVKKREGNLPYECRKFSVDPQITSFDVLQSLLARAFDIKSNFTITYRVVDDYGQETYLSLLSDWDLDAAFLSASDPCLCLYVDLKPFDGPPKDVEEEPEIPYQVRDGSPTPNLVSHITSHLPESKVTQNKIAGTILNHMEKTFNMVQRALNLGDDQSELSMKPPRPPLTDVEFRKFLDPVGRLINPKELRLVVYRGGVDHSLRKVVWKHLLNVYPEGMSGKERIEYMKGKSSEYLALRNDWKDMIQHEKIPDDVKYVTNMVRKDVLRTDRQHRFYAGSDDNQNVAALFNILTTYALNHPSVSYCQGMSDLASPILVVMNEEGHAYICFCALMRRLKPNFLLDGEAVTLKFQHLTEGLMYYDPEFFTYLKMQQADDLLFCYRWLLLEMKREFAFDDALHMLEVLWSSLPPSAPDPELMLFDIKFIPHAPKLTPCSPLLKSRENVYTKVRAIRRHGSSVSLNNFNLPSKDHAKLSETWHSSRFQSQSGSTRRIHSLDEASVRSEVAVRQFQSLDEHAIWNTRSESPVVTTNISKLPRSGSDGISTRNTSCHENPNSKAEPGSTQKTAANSTNDEQTAASPQKIVKNLNEFFNFASPSKRPVSYDKTDGIGNSDSGLPIVQSTIFEKEAENNYQENKENTKPVFATRTEGKEANSDIAEDESSTDESSEYYPMTTSVTQELKQELENLDRQVFGEHVHNPEESQSSTNFDEGSGTYLTATNIVPQQVQVPGEAVEIQKCVWENPLHCRTPDEHPDLDFDGNVAEKSKNGMMVLESQHDRTHSTESGPYCDEEQVSEISNEESLDLRRDQYFRCDSSKNSSSVDSTLTSVSQDSEPVFQDSPSDVSYLGHPTDPVGVRLPPPRDFAGGNPFLMFLCLAVLKQHRDVVMRQRMDYNELAMYFDKMIRKHNVIRVLNQARQMFAEYLSNQDWVTGLGDVSGNIKNPNFHC